MESSLPEKGKVLANLPPDLEVAFFLTADTLAIRRHLDFPGG